MLNQQTVVNNAIAAARSEEMKTSEQLTLGEIILKLKAVKNREYPVVFDVKNYCPISIGSWRGSYCELAISYGTGYDIYGGFNGEVKRELEGGYKCYKQVSTKLPKKPKVKDLLKILKQCMGKTFTGYKGGDFLMGKITPVWVANYSTSSGFRKDSTAVVDILEGKNKVIIKTKGLKY